MQQLLLATPLTSCAMPAELKLRLARRQCWRWGQHPSVT
jgi:hypothetical protein